jgi:hypothetical protein
MPLRGKVLPRYKAAEADSSMHNGTYTVKVPPNV